MGVSALHPEAMGISSWLNKLDLLLVAMREHSYHGKPWVSQQENGRKALL